METYYLHDYSIDDAGTRLVYLRKAEGIDTFSKRDEMDEYLRKMIFKQYPLASEEVEVIANDADIKKWDGRLLNHHHLTANYRCATFINCGTMITINYASVLVPFDVPMQKYESVGRHCSMDYANYGKIILNKSQNPPLLLHQHPLIHGITCYREFTVPYDDTPDVVFFMYHYKGEYVRAEVNLSNKTTTLSHSGNESDESLIKKDLYNLKNGMLMSLKLNREKGIFSKSKQILMKTLSTSALPIDKDFKNYLQFAEEL